MSLLDSVALGITTIFLIAMFFFSATLFLSVKDMPFVVDNVDTQTRNVIIDTYVGSDYVIPTFIFFLAITGIIVSANLREKQVFVIFMFAVLMINVVFGEIITRVWSNLMYSGLMINGTDIGSITELFPITSYLMQNYMLLSSVFIVLWGIALYGIKGY